MVTDNEWQPISTAPARKWIRTKLTGENGTNVCAKIVHDDGEVEWIERDGGRTTITHHSFAPPDLWKPLEA